MKMQKGFILNFTPTGMIPTKEMTQNVPILPSEIIDDVLEAAELGVSMVHLHARDPETGLSTYRKEIYAEIISGIRQKNKDLILCVSTSGRDFPEFEQRSEVLELTGELKPDFASLTLSSLNFNKQASMNSPGMIQALVKKMSKNNIRPELEAFDIGMINYSKYLIRKKFMKAPYYFNLILGNIACAQANLLNLGLLINELPEKSIWAAGGIGKHQVNINAMALIAGGGVRLGLEDNIWYDEERTRLATNRDLIKRILVIARALGLKPYEKHEVKHLLGV